MAEMMAARSTPAIVFRTKCAMAVSAPVLPELTQADARPSFTRSMATRMEESFLRRMASRGESPMATTVGGRNDLEPGARIAVGQDAQLAARSARARRPTARAGPRRRCSACNDAGDVLARLLVAAHHIDGDRQHAATREGCRGSCLRETRRSIPALRLRRASRSRACRDRSHPG